jgi:hypothetical protein
MLTFLRRVIGLALLLLALFLTYRSGVGAYASALADPIQAAVTRPCRPVEVASVNLQSRCAGSWTRAGGTAVTGQVYGASDADVGGAVEAAPYGRYAFVVPTGTDRTLGLLSGPLLLIGLVLLFKRRRRRYHPSRRRRRAYAHGWGGSGYSDSDSDGWGWGDSGSDSGGGDSGGGGDGGGGDGGGGGD